MALLKTKNEGGWPTVGWTKLSDDLTLRSSSFWYGLVLPGRHGARGLPGDDAEAHERPRRPDTVRRRDVVHRGGRRLRRGAGDAPVALVQVEPRRKLRVRGPLASPTAAVGGLDVWHGQVSGEKAGAALEHGVELGQISATCSGEAVGQCEQHALSRGIFLN